MSIVYGIIAIAAPLLLVSLGALISEYAGCMALFLDGIVNFAAFFCYTFTVLTHSAILGIVLSIILTTLFVYSIGLLTEKIHANFFLAALALSMIATGVVSVASVNIFNTRGVLTSDMFMFNTAHTRLVTTIIALVCTGIGAIALKKTKLGLYIRITGSNPDVLQAKGINAGSLRILSWSIAAFFASLTGCILTVRLSSFVPNIASGIGWTALAAVFLGKKNTATVIAAVCVFATAQYGANNLQNIQGLQAIPSFILLALPYFTALFLILIAPQKVNRQ